MASELEEALHSLSRRFGPGVLDDADGLGPLLDDMVVAREEQVRAQVVVDAVRLGSWQRLLELRSHGAAEVAALDSAAQHLTETRGGTDRASARWALSMLGHAAGVLSDPTAAPTSGPPGDRPPGTPGPPAPPVGPLAPTQAPPVGDSEATQAAPTYSSPATIPPPSETAQASPEHPGWHAQGSPRPPAPSSRSRRTFGLSRRALVALVIGLAVAVAAGVGLAVAMTGDPGDENTAGSDGQPGDGAGKESSGDAATLQEQFGALGTWAAAGPLQCEDERARSGEESALSCRLDDISVRMVTFGTADALMADRSEWVHRVKTQPGAVMTRTPAETVVHDPGARTVYWDSASAQQSAVLQYGEDSEAATLFASLATGLELPAPPGLLPSTELLEFAPDEIRPDGCHTDPELPATAQEITQLICPLGDGYEVRLVEVFEGSTLVTERRELEGGIRDKPGTLVAGSWFAGEAVDQPAGAIIEFVHGGVVHPEDEGEARLYWDDTTCLCWGVLWAPDGDMDALRGYWQDGSRVSSLD